jgi:hypothetical protein
VTLKLTISNEHTRQVKRSKCYQIRWIKKNQICAETVVDDEPACYLGPKDSLRRNTYHDVLVMVSFFNTFSASLAKCEW